VESIECRMKKKGVEGIGGVEWCGVIDGSRVT
jgi:hypothetical protein